MSYLLLNYEENHLCKNHIGLDDSVYNSKHLTYNSYLCWVDMDSEGKQCKRCIQWNSCIGILYLSPDVDCLFNNDKDVSINLTKEQMSDIWMFDSDEKSSYIKVVQNKNILIISYINRELIMGGRLVIRRVEVYICIDKLGRVLIKRTSNGEYAKNFTFDLEIVKTDTAPLEVHPDKPFVFVYGKIMRVDIDYSQGKINLVELTNIWINQHGYGEAKTVTFMDNKCVFTNGIAYLHYLNLVDNPKIFQIRCDLLNMVLPSCFKGLLFIFYEKTIDIMCEDGPGMKKILTIGLNERPYFVSIDKTYLRINKTNKLTYICTIPINRREWKEDRLIWIGNLKERNNECLLSRLPRELVRHILSFDRYWYYDEKMIDEKKVDVEKVTPISNKNDANVSKCTVM